MTSGPVVNLSGSHFAHRGDADHHVVFAPGARRPIVGIQLDFALTHAWAVEIDALHRKLTSTTTLFVSSPIELPDGSTSTWTQTLTPWEFPVQVKYRFRTHKFRPMLMLGPSFRPAGSGTGLSHVGLTAGAGTELRSRGFRISPAIRYTRWSTRPVGLVTGAPLRNQLAFLVGVDRPSTESRVSVFGQGLSIGFIAGLGLGRDFQVGAFEPDQRPERNSGIFGIMMEAALSKNWSIEVDGLYRPLHGWDTEFGRPVRFAHLTWEFPALVKRRLSAERPLVPFVEGGPSFRAEGNLNLQRVSHFGATAGLGVEAKWHWLKVAPTLRYTRWGGSNYAGIPRTFKNQIHLLVCFSF